MASRRLAALLAALVLPATLLAGGCGIPRSGEPVLVGRAPGPDDATTVTQKSLPAANDATTAEELVRYYLAAAAAGDYADGGQRLDDAARLARTFLVEEARADWQPSGQIIVVDTTLTSVGGTVRAQFRPIGELTERGSLLPLSADARVPAEHEFKTRQAAGGGLALESAPGALLLSRDALGEYYAARPIYFEDDRESALVPDLRYFTLNGGDRKRRFEVIERLLAGPSPQLLGLVKRIPENIQSDNPVVRNSVIVVNLVVPAAAAPDVRRLAHQIRWSLRPDTLPVELSYNGTRQFVDSGDEYLRSNPAERRDPFRAEEYAVTAGRIVPVPPGAQPVPVIGATAKDNGGVVRAALNRDRTAVAVVRRAGARGPYQLSFGREDKVAGPLSYEVVREGAAMSRPVWLGGGDHVLIAVDGQLLSVSRSNVITVADAPAAVVSVSVAPDQRHVALVAGGLTYVGLLRYGTAAPGQPIAVTGLRAVNAGRVTNHTGVAWSYRDAVVIAGSVPTGAALVQVSVDGGWRSELPLNNLAGTTISQVVSVPLATYYGNENDRGTILLEANGVAYKVFRETIQLLGSETTTAPFMLD